MFKNYFKSAWRNILKNKAYSALNILGLATGMAVALLIGLWVYNERSYDKFLPDYQRQYQVKRNFNSNGEILTFASTSLKLADALRAQIPEIQYVAESDWMGPHGLMVGDKKFYIRGGTVGRDFLKIFPYPVLRGDQKNALMDPYSIVVTEATAKMLFGDLDPIGKMVKFDNKNELKVTAVLKDIPKNSSITFNFLIPFDYLEQTNPFVKQDRNGGFDENGYKQFVLVKKGFTQQQVEAKIKDIEKTEKGNRNAMLSEVVLHPIERLHLYSEYKNGKNDSGFIEYVKMFTIIGGLVLLIACINFINLATARSEKRAREVGVRKAIGSLRRHLIFQFLLESMLLTFMAFALSVIFVQLALPAFNMLTGKTISIPYGNGIFWLIIILGIMVTALIAGSRPAFYLSSFQPIKVLKGNMQVGHSATLPRKILVVLQFTCSIALIISTIIIYRQVQHAKDRPTGYDIDRLMMTDINADLGRNFAAIKNELLQRRIVTGVSSSSSPINDIYWHSDIDKWPGKIAGETVEMGALLVSDDYFKTAGIQMAEGRPFLNASDTVNVIFNETAIKRLRIKNPINQQVRFQGRQVNIVGVAKDALMLSPFGGADPTIFVYTTNPQGTMFYRLSKNTRTSDAITQLTSIFNKYNPAYPYDYKFADASYEEKFSLEILIGRLAGIFATLAIFVSCLGLFGLAAYIAEQRTKEIGIRKVLGATILQVWMLLSKDFILLVLISCLIATPLTLYFVSDWLAQYSYRIDIGVSVFILSAIFAVVITITTISFQAIRAAIANPVKSLRTE